ncbi:MAG: hypothetical protein NVSMB51_01630 [Solirubrobacteraceae bacterium]
MLGVLARALVPSRARRRRLAQPALPPLTPPPGRTVIVAGRGEFFVRDSGGDGPPLLLLHGWIASADLNWIRCYEPLIQAGYRVIALDHRGHGRGLRSSVPFRLADCAEDAAALLRELGCGPAVAVGYSMGGPITQLLARAHPELLSGIVLCATSRAWSEPEFKRLWRLMWLVRRTIAHSPQGFWSTMMRISGVPVNESTPWLIAELTRGDAAALAEAGRELGRFDSRPWLSELRPPAAVVVTTGDRSVPARLQRELAEQLRAPCFDVDGDHMVVGLPDGVFNVGLLAALRSLS